MVSSAFHLVCLETQNMYNVMEGKNGVFAPREIYVARGPHISPEIPDIMSFIPLWTKKTNRTDSATGIMLISFETIAILASSEVL